MDYKYLEQWAREQTSSGLFFRGTKRWRDQYALFFRGNEYLQVNLQSQDPFCFFTTSEIINWKPAAELSMLDEHLLRSRLEGSGILEHERIIYLDFSKADPFGDKIKQRLFLELIPGFSNIILTHQEDSKWKIIDCSRKITLAENPFRQLIPGVFYELPPSGFENISVPVLKPLSFDADLKIREETEAGFGKMNALLESLYYRGWLIKISEQTRGNKLNNIKKEIKKKEKKLIKQTKELKSAEDGKRWLKLGELLKANFHALKRGMKSVAVRDYYQEKMPEITIKLHPDKSPGWNVEYYFRKYRKSIRGKQIITGQMEKTRLEISSLQEDLREIKSCELILPGEFVLPQTTRVPLAEKLTRININESWELVIGRNSKENDFITTRLGRSQDWWFHTRIFKGTHILLRNFQNKKPSEELILLSCRLAAFYSKARTSTNVPVDYTQIRYVRKPRGSDPGYVIYRNQKTMYVDPLDLRSARKIIEKEKV